MPYRFTVFEQNILTFVLVVFTVISCNFLTVINIYRICIQMYSFCIVCLYRCVVIWDGTDPEGPTWASVR